jgi:hypothetical protein
MYSAKPEALVLICLLLTGACGCDPTHSQCSRDFSSSSVQEPTDFNPGLAGSIRGLVVWSGTTPDIPSLTTPPDPLAGPVLRKRQLRPNPNVPEIDPASHGINNAVVFLRGVDPRRSKPWDIPHVVIEQCQCQYRVIQNGKAGRVGIVRLGDEVEMISRDETFYALHAAGAAYFTLTFVDPGLPRRRALRDKGILELSSAAGYYWMRAYLHVDDHPYYALTSRQGEFQLTEVPEGNYGLGIWLPNWHVLRHERDPESAIIARLFFRPALQKFMQVRVRPNEVEEVIVSLSGTDFGPGSRKQSGMTKLSNPTADNH